MAREQALCEEASQAIVPGEISEEIDCMIYEMVITYVLTYWCNINVNRFKIITSQYIYSYLMLPDKKIASTTANSSSKTHDNPESSTFHNCDIQKVMNGLYIGD